MNQIDLSSPANQRESDLPVPSCRSIAITGGCGSIYRSQLTSTVSRCADPAWVEGNDQPSLTAIRRTHE